MIWWMIHISFAYVVFLVAGACVLESVGRIEWKWEKEVKKREWVNLNFDDRVAKILVRIAIPNLHICCLFF